MPEKWGAGTTLQTLIQFLESPEPSLQSPENLMFSEMFLHNKIKKKHTHRSRE